MNQVEIRILGMVSLSFSSEILNPLYGMKQIEWQFSFKNNFFEEDIPNVLYVGARICIIVIVICCCCCCCFIVFVRCLVSRLHKCPFSVTSFVLVIFICISFIFCSRVIYFGQLSSLRNISEHIVPWVSFFRLLVWSHSSCKCPCLFRFFVFQYFHSYVVSYFMPIRVFVILLFSVTVFNNVSCQVC